MERKDEQKQPGEEQQPMAQDKNKRKPEEQDDERENTVGKVPDPQGEDTKGDRSKA